VGCFRCGTYRITRRALLNLRGEELSPREGANISGYLRENQGSQIKSDNFSMLRNQRTPSFHERADKLLLAFEKRTSFIGEFLRWDKSWIALGWCIDDKELLEILKYLAIVERIDSDIFKDFGICKILPDGWKHLEDIKQINIDSQQGFVAMWFDDAMKKIYDDIIAPAIEDAGYKPHKVDLREHNDRIDDEIIAQIRRSRFVLADFTGQRGGVYYEAGFAKGLGLEVIWTCRNDELDKLHFDVRQYNCILWERDKLEEFKMKITYRIESVLGRGLYSK